VPREKFWPIYEAYVDELVAINAPSMTSQAVRRELRHHDRPGGRDISRKWVTVDESVAQLRLKYNPDIPQGTVGPEYSLVFSTGPKDPTDDRLAVSLATPLIEP